jgi:hypothetical protein
VRAILTAAEEILGPDRVVQPAADHMPAQKKVEA